MSKLTCPHCGVSVEAEQLYCPNCTRSLRLTPTDTIGDLPKSSTPRTVGWIIGLGVAGVVALAAIPMLIIPAARSRTMTLSPSGSPAQRTACMSNLKQLATGAMIYMSDYDDRVFPTASYQPLLMPYIKNNSVFYCPTSSMMFAPNTELLKVEAKKIKDPAKVVLFYEGAAKTLSTAHGNVANVAFADSHVKPVALPAGTRSLVWKP